jgi:hypothetical protein
LVSISSYYRLHLQFLNFSGSEFFLTIAVCYTSGPNSEPQYADRFHPLKPISVPPERTTHER